VVEYGWLELPREGLPVVLTSPGGHKNGVIRTNGYPDDAEAISLFTT